MLPNRKNVTPVTFLVFSEYRCARTQKMRHTGHIFCVWQMERHSTQKNVAIWATFSVLSERGTAEDEKHACCQ